MDSDGKSEDNKISISLCNSIGTPVDSKFISVDPLYCGMNRFDFIVLLFTFTYF